jgi:hypothetical protein
MACGCSSPHCDVPYFSLCSIQSTYGSIVATLSISGRCAVSEIKGWRDRIGGEEERKEERRGEKRLITVRLVKKRGVVVRVPSSVENREHALP